MILIVHAEDRAALDPSPETREIRVETWAESGAESAAETGAETLAGLMREADLVVLAGPDAAFGGAAVTAAVTAAVGPDAGEGRVMRLDLLQPGASGFEVLEEGLRACAPLLAERLLALRYLRAGGALPADLRAERGAAPPASPDAPAHFVAWSADASGALCDIRLAPVVATSPLLPPLMRHLAALPLSEPRRLAFLAAAFAGA